MQSITNLEFTSNISTIITVEPDYLGNLNSRTAVRDLLSLNYNLFKYEY